MHTHIYIYFPLRKFSQVYTVPWPKLPLCSPVFLPRFPTVGVSKMKYSTTYSWCTQTQNRSACLACADVEMPGTHPRSDAEEGALGISTWEVRNLGWKNPCGHAGSTFISEDEWVSAGKRGPKAVTNSAVLSFLEEGTKKQQERCEDSVRTARRSPGSWAKEVLGEGGWPAAPYPSFNLQGCHSRLYTKDSPLISFLFSAGGEFKSIAFVFFFSLQTLTTFDNKECLLLWKPSAPTHMKEEIKT